MRRFLLSLALIPCMAMGADRAYTVQEIDELRSAVENRFLWGNANGPSPDEQSGAIFSESEKVVTVEQHVRTYMLAGITGADLRKADKR